MSPSFKTIAYYTIGNQYQTISEDLKRSCNDFNIPLLLKPIEDLGSWEKNTHYKAKFILDCLNTTDQNLLYVDVDAIFKSYPDLIETLNCDIAYRTENFRWRKNEALSGTIFFQNNDRVKDFVKRWIELNDKNPAIRSKPETWEQANMQKTLFDSSDIMYYNLPPEYTFIFDHTKKLYPGLKPVIEHFQASRKVNI